MQDRINLLDTCKVIKEVYPAKIIKPGIAQRRKGAKKNETRFSPHYRAKNSFKLQATNGLLVLTGEAGTNRGFLCALASLRENIALTA